MRRWICKLAGLMGILVASAAHATITCSMSVTNVYPIYNPSPPRVNVDEVGSVTLTCTRTAGEASTTYWIGSDWASSSRLTRQNGAQTLTYRLYRKSNYSGNWAMTNANGISGTLTFSGPTASVTKSYYFEIPKSNSGQPAGLYDDAIVLTQRFTFNGANQSTATLTPVASIIAECRVSTAPAPLVLNYASFSPSPVSASTNFAVSCTKDTTFTMTLDTTNGTLLGLNYFLALSAGRGTGNALPQAYAVTGTIAANQSGTCATGTCSGTQIRTITITY